MATLLLGPTPPELDEFLERRRALGQDGHDEVWEGVYHVAPMANAWHGYAVAGVLEALRTAGRAARLVGSTAFNLGDPDDYRVPDAGFHRGVPTDTWVATAAIVVEVVSPYDESYAKLPFYATRGVDEVLIVDPGPRAARWYVRREGGDGYDERDASALLGVTSTQVVAALTWPE